MGRNNTKAVKNITKMYEQLGLAQDDIQQVIFGKIVEGACRFFQVI